MKHQSLRALLLLFPVLFTLSLAPAAHACDADSAYDYNRNDLGTADPNDLAMMLRSAKVSSCAGVAATKLYNKIHSMNQANVWTNTWSGGALSLALATGLELGAQGQLSASLDAELRDAANAYVLNPQSTCGFTSTNWTEGNTCVEDYALGAAGHGWRAAYYRLTGRDWKYARTETINAMKQMLSANMSCIRKLDPNAPLSPTRGVCNGSLADLTAVPPTGVLYSINKHSQIPAYGIGQMTHLSSGFVGLEVAQEKIFSSDIPAEARTIAQQFFKEGVEKADVAGTTRATWNATSCVHYNAAMTDLITPYPCWDEEVNQAFHDSKIGDTSYRPDMFVIRDFYTKYAFPTYTGSGAWWNFDDDLTGNDNAKFNDLFLDDVNKVWGPGRREMYYTMAVTWLTESARPELHGRPYYTGGIRRASYYVTNSGVGAPEATSITRGTTGNLTIVDLDTSDDLVDGDPVAIQNVDGRYWHATNGGGSSIWASVNYINSNATWTIVKICGTNCDGLDPIAHGDTFALRAPDGTHYVTVSVPGTLSATATGYSTTSEQFKFERYKTE